jgi:hypothetical protein
MNTGNKQDIVYDDKMAQDEIKPLETYQQQDKQMFDGNGHKEWTWPTEGRFATYYQYWMFCHCVYIALFVVSRISFEEKPRYFVVCLEWYIDAVYIIDMVRCFTEPYSHDGKLVTNRRKIVIYYLKSWFLLDVYAFYPLAFLRYISDWNTGSLNAWDMFIVQNYERLPRFYKIMLFLQLGRARNGMRYLRAFLKGLDLRIEYQNLLKTFITLAYILHVAGCFWYAAH